ncbi:MAG: M20/M25/M40 family metallo-hydrolase [Desulfobulbaceae bacterium]|nr:M20/M25/M40 family metallo-hydrolase [Desulfobulbaceae bacterium]
MDRKKFRICPQGKWQWLRAFCIPAALLLVLMSGLFFCANMPGTSFTGTLPALTSGEQHTADQLKKHVYTLAQDIGARNIWQPPSMATTVSYLEEALSSMGYNPKKQEFTAYNVVAVNLEVEIPGKRKPEEVVVVGAHYDSVSDCPGANDNASGVAGLLELARLLADTGPDKTIRLVFFANEEPPFFFSNKMGSAFYAARCKKRKENIVAMLCLETIGYYSDEPDSQEYPFPFSIFYPDTANFIGFVGNIGSRQLVRQSIKSFRDHARFPSEGLAAPSFIPGVGWSDHLSFWRKGYKAVMVTDTAFNRYAPYHTSADTAEKLNYERMARVVCGLVPTVMDLAEK